MNASDFFHFTIPALSADDFSESRSTGTIDQLKNAGYLHYFTGTDIPYTLSSYESSINSLLQMEKIEFQEISDKGISFLKEEIDPTLLASEKEEFQKIFREIHIDFT